MTTYGVTAQGFVAKQQDTIITELQQTIQANFGQNVNLGSETSLGVLVGVFAEREALIWQIAEAVYSSQFPGGAEGVSVDNILALNSLRRNAAAATVTDPTPSVQANGIPLYGLVCYGTPGTPIPAGSLIQTSSSPVRSFTTDAAITIASAVSAQQQLVFSSTPTTGAYQLAIVDPAGVTVTTASIPYSAQAAISTLTFAITPTMGTFYLMANGTIVGPFTPANYVANLQAALIAAGYSGAAVSPISGGVSISFGSVSAPMIGTANTSVTFASAPSSGAYTLNVGGFVTSSLAYNATPAAIQAAIRAIPAYSEVFVAAFGTGFAINWGILTPPTVTVPTNTTGQAATVGSTFTLDQPSVNGQSVQAYVNALHDFSNVAWPYTDVQCVTGSGLITLNFGALTPLAGQAASGNQPQPLINVAANSLFNGGTFTNVSVIQNVVGSLAQGTGSATCTVTGPTQVAAGGLNTIGSSLSGWTGVTNQLVCLTGSNVETDTEALVRRQSLLASQANGPLQSIVEKVLLISGVIAAVGFQNLSNAAVQMVTFASAPVSGTFQLQLQTGTTSSLAFNATAAQLQTAIQALSGLGTVQVAGSAQYGYQVDFNGSFGGQAQPLIQVVNNTTGVTLSAAFGRYPHSFEIVAEGGSSTNIANTIYGSMPAGIASYGSPAATTTANVTAGSTAMTVANATGISVGNLISGSGIPPGTSVAAISGTAVTLSLPANNAYSGATYLFTYGARITDAFGNPLVIQFSRPVQILFYVTLTLVTDTYVTPGVSASGTNTQSKFNAGSIPTIQADLAAVGNAVAIGGLVVGFGTSGLVGAFNAVPGIVGYTLNFGTSPSPSGNANVQLLPEQFPLFQASNITVSYS